MKRLLSLLILTPMILWSCNNDASEQERTPEGRGALKIVTAVDIKVTDIVTRATSTDADGYTMYLTGPDGETASMLVSAGKEQQDLAAGQYNIVITSHPGETTPAAAFDNQIYTATTTAEVTANATETVAMICHQANAGVYFEYDQASFTAAGIDPADVVPTIAGTDGSLEFSGANRDSKGYFQPGTVRLTIMNGTEPATFGGVDYKDLVFSSEELWKINLSVEATSQTGGMSLTVSVEPVTVPNKSDDIVLDLPDGVETTMTVSAGDLVNATAEQLAAVKELTIIGDAMTAAAWAKINQFQVLESVELSDFTGSIPENTLYAGNQSLLPATLITFSAPVLAGNLPSNIFRKSNLVTVNLPKVGMCEGGNTFMDCKKLKNVTLTSLRSTYESTFSGCTALEEILLNASTICMNDFAGCTALKVVKLGGSNIYLESNVFPSDLTPGIDLYLKPAEMARVSGNKWNSYTWKSITEF